MKKLKIILMIIAIFLLFSSSAYSALDKKIKVAGYIITASVEETRNGLEIRGQIGRGKHCKKLRMEFVCRNEIGDKATVIAIADNVEGAGTRLFNGTKAGYKDKHSWSISKVNVDCISGEDIEVADSLKGRVAIKKRGPTININGQGPQASNLFIINKGLTVFKYKHNGDGHFDIWLKDNKGNDVDLVANFIGNLKGSMGINIKRSGKYFVNVKADPEATWSISIKISDKKETTSSPNYSTEANITPSSSEDSLKIWEDEKGVLHIEQ